MAILPFPFETEAYPVLVGVFSRIRCFLDGLLIKPNTVVLLITYLLPSEQLTIPDSRDVTTISWLFDSIASHPTQD
jgi:hypothetical protein